MFLALTTALTAATFAPSVGDQLQLDWSAPPGCPQQQQVRAAIDVNLAREAFGDQVAAVVVRGSIERDGAGWVLHVRTVLPAGHVERDLFSRDCAELAEAAGLIIAVALDPLRVVQTTKERRTAVVVDPWGSERSRPRGGGQAEDASTAQGDRSRAPESDSGPESPSEVATGPRVRVGEPGSESQSDPTSSQLAGAGRPSVDLRLGVLGEVGAIGKARGGVWLGLGLVGRRFRLDLAGQYWAPRRLVPFVSEPSAGVVVQLGGVAVRGCWVAPRRRVALATCAGLEGGAARGRGTGLGRARSSHAPWLAATVGPELTWISRRRVGVWGAADAMLHVLRPQWSVQELGVAARTGAAGFRVVLGPTVRL